MAWNVGYDYLGIVNGDLFYSLAWGIAISDKVGIYIEPYGQYLSFMTWEASADVGFTYLVNNDVQFDYSFGLGLNHEMNYHSVGLSVRLGSEN